MGTIGLFQKAFIVGLDIGSTSIKLAQFVKGEDGLYLARASMRELSYASNEESHEKEVLSILQDLLQGIDIKKTKFIVVVTSPATALKMVTVPYMPKEELRESIKLTAKSLFPFPIDKSFLDFEIVEDFVEKGVRKYRLLVATSPVETVKNSLSLLSKLDIRPDSFIPASLGLQKVAERYHPDKARTMAFLEIGRYFTELDIFKGKNLVFSRRIPVSGEDFTKSMMAALVSDTGRTELSFDKAERIKRDIGIPAVGESKIVDGNISTAQILSMVRLPLEQLASEIDRCFGYYKEERGEGEDIDSLVLFGGSSALKGMGEFLSEELKIETICGDSLEGIKIAPGVIVEKDKVSSRFAVAIGSALTGGKGINLLPEEIKGEAALIFKRTTLEVIAVTVILTLTFLYVGMRLQVANFQKRISVSRLELASLGPQMKELETQRLVDRILKGRPYWEDVFKELSNVTPPNIYFTALDMQGRDIKVYGIAVSKEPEKDLSSFILTLEKGLFNNVKLVTTKEIKEKSANEFEIKFWVD